MNPKNIVSHLRPWLLSLVIVLAAIFVLTFLFPQDQGNLIDPINAFSVVAISFIFALLLRINYANMLFIVTVIIGIILVSVLNFTQGLGVVLIVLIVQKLLKVL